MTYNIVFKNFLLRASSRKLQAAVFKITTLWGPFSKTSVFGAPKHRLCVDGELKRRKNNSVFKNIRIRVDVPSANPL